jgi:hypothetical protein
VFRPDYQHRELVDKLVTDLKKALDEGELWCDTHPRDSYIFNDCCLLFIPCLKKTFGSRRPKNPWGSSKKCFEQCETCTTLLCLPLRAPFFGVHLRTRAINEPRDCFVETVDLFISRKKERRETSMAPDSIWS